MSRSPRRASWWHAPELVVDCGLPASQVLLTAGDDLTENRLELVGVDGGADLGEEVADIPVFLQPRGDAGLLLGVSVVAPDDGSGREETADFLVDFLARILTLIIENREDDTDVVLLTIVVPGDVVADIPASEQLESAFEERLQRGSASVVVEQDCSLLIHRHISSLSSFGHSQSTWPGDITGLNRLIRTDTNCQVS
ncbi:MAG TPA: hypothetical protein VJA27_01245 [Patescibacteria group bacterium]|nr:hypothetical protein [Patescibacteria group bacterium]